MFCVSIVMPTLALAQGVSAPWDVTQAAKDLSDQAERLQPLLDQLTPEQRVGSEIFFGGYRSWGFGMAVDIQRNEIFRTPG